MSGRYIKEERAGKPLNPKNKNQFKLKLNFRKLLPLPLFVFNLMLFFYIIPDDVAENNSIVFALIGSITTLVLSFWVVIALMPKFLEETPIFTGLMCISTLFIFGIAFITKTVNYSSEQLQEFGVVTEATVIDKTRIYGKPPSTAEYMEVQFKTESNKWQKATLDISKSDYDKYQRGDKVYIRYSAEHPKIARIDYEKN